MQIEKITGTISTEEIQAWIRLNIGRLETGTHKHEIEVVQAEAVTDYKSAGCFGGIRFTVRLKPVKKT